MAINGRFVAISRPGGSKRVDQRGSRLDQVRPGEGVGGGLGGGLPRPKKCIALYMKGP